VAVWRCAIQILFDEIRQMTVQTFLRVCDDGEVVDLAIKAVEERVMATGNVPRRVSSSIVGEERLIEGRESSQVGRHLAISGLSFLWNAFVLGDGTFAEFINVFACGVRRLVEVGTPDLALEVWGETTTKDAFLPLPAHRICHTFCQNHTTLGHDTYTRICGDTSRY